MKTPTIARIQAIARVCHEANRAYCRTLGDDSQDAWDVAPTWQKESAENGVLHAAMYPFATPEQSHECWLEGKRAAGWKHGPVKDPAKKEHPCLVPYDELPPEQRAKDALFLAVARTLLLDA